MNSSFLDLLVPILAAILGVLTSEPFQTLAGIFSALYHAGAGVDLTGG